MKKVKMENIMKLFELNTPEEKEIEKNAKIACDTIKKALTGEKIDNNKINQAKAAINKRNNLERKKTSEVKRALREIENEAAKQSKKLDAP